MHTKRIPQEAVERKSRPGTTKKTQKFTGLLYEIPASFRVQSRVPAPRVMPEAVKILNAVGYSQEEIYSFVVPKRTLARRQSRNEPLSVEETDKALRLERIASLASKVFGNAEKASRWLRKPKDRLDGATPLELLASEAGARVVEEMLLQIEHGVYA